MRVLLVTPENRMSPEALWNGYMWFRRQLVSRSCILERLRRSGVRPLQSFALNWGYARAIDNALPGWPIPCAERSAALDWPGGASDPRGFPDARRLLKAGGLGRS